MIVLFCRCVTTKGSILNTMTFTSEDDLGDPGTNDDRILLSAANLCRTTSGSRTTTSTSPTAASAQIGGGEFASLFEFYFQGIIYYSIIF